MASIRAYIVVGPTWAKPAFLRAFESARDSGEVVGTSAVVRGAGGGSGRKDQMNASSPPCVSQGDGRAGVGDRGVDLAAVAHDAGVGHQPLHVVVPEGRDGVGVEAREGGAEVVALVEDREPRETRLERLERQPLEVGGLPGDPHAPLGVVVGHVHRVAGAPRAAGHAVVAHHCPHARAHDGILAHGTDSAVSAPAPSRDRGPCGRACRAGPHRRRTPSARGGRATSAPAAAPAKSRSPRRRRSTP